MCVQVKEKNHKRNKEKIEEGIHPNSIYEADVILTPKSESIISENTNNISHEDIHKSSQPNDSKLNQVLCQKIILA